MAESGVGPGTVGTQNVQFSGTAADNADGVAPVGTGLSRQAAELFAFNGATFDRLAEQGDGADAIGTGGVGRLVVMARSTLFNGSSFDRGRSIAAQGDGLGVSAAMQPSSTYGVTTATNATATVTFAAVAGQSHRLMGFAANYTSTPTAAAVANVTDGAVGVFSILASTSPMVPFIPAGGIKASAVNQAMAISLGAGGVGVLGIVTLSKLTA